MTRAPAAWLLAGAIGCCIGCGGGNGGSSPSPSPAPSPGPAPAPVLNPCESQAVQELEAPAAGARLSKLAPADGSPRWRVLDALWTHEARPRRAAATAAGRDAATSVDVGEIAVLRDEGDLILPPNVYDLKDAGLRFTRNGAGGYDVRTDAATFRATLGTRLTLDDDATVQVNVPFAFPFYAESQRTSFVNSDGNVTFGEGDAASTDRNVARLLSGPPRVAPFLADLDPTAGGGRIFVNAASDHYTVTWCGVRGFDSTQSATVQTTLLPDGAVEMRFAGSITLGNAIVGLSPGRTGSFTPVNLNAAGTTAGGGGAIGERFSESSQLDTVAAARAFYRSHADAFEQLVFWTDVRVTQDAFAYETTVANAIRGIGLEVFDFARDFGSAGRLQSFAVMDFLGKYPEDPTQRFLGENSTVSVLGQEVGHRWLAFFDFRDHTGQQSGALLGRDRAHWSFFMNSEGSVLEGNDIEDLGGGSFRTGAAVRRYSRLDQYAMGLRPPTDVPVFFYVADPVNLSQPKEADSAPAAGVTFNGTRRDVLIDDIIAIHGPRQPSAAESPKVHRQAFVYIVGAGRSVDPAQVAKVDRIRREWETFFLAATDGRMRAETRLSQ